MIASVADATLCVGSLEHPGVLRGPIAAPFSFGVPLAELATALQRASLGGTVRGASVLLLCGRSARLASSLRKEQQKAIGISRMGNDPRRGAPSERGRKSEAGRDPGIARQADRRHSQLDDAANCGSSNLTIVKIQLFATADVLIGAGDRGQQLHINLKRRNLPSRLARRRVLSAK